MERLREMPASARVRELSSRAESYERALRTWSVRPPSADQRAVLLKLVLELDVEAIALGRERNPGCSWISGPTGSYLSSVAGPRKIRK